MDQLDDTLDSLLMELNAPTNRKSRSLSVSLNSSPATQRSTVVLGGGGATGGGGGSLPTSPVGEGRNRSNSVASSESNSFTMKRNNAAAIEYLALQQQAKEWIEEVMQELILDNDLSEELKDGVTLCKLMAILSPGSSINVITSTPHAMLQLNNIQAFLDAARGFGIHETDLFVPLDLFEKKNMPKVLHTVKKLAEHAASKDPAAARWKVAQRTAFSNTEIQAAMHLPGVQRRKMTESGGDDDRGARERSGSVGGRDRSGSVGVEERARLRDEKLKREETSRARRSIELKIEDRRTEDSHSSAEESSAVIDLDDGSFWSESIEQERERLFRAEEEDRKQREHREQEERNRLAREQEEFRFEQEERQRIRMRLEEEEQQRHRMRIQQEEEERERKRLMWEKEERDRIAREERERIRIQQAEEQRVRSMRASSAPPSPAVQPLGASSPTTRISYYGSPAQSSTVHRAMAGRISGTCSKCNGAIVEMEYIKAMDRVWHVHHFTCVTCARAINGVFYIQQGQPECPACTENRHRCTKCGRGITGQFTVQPGGDKFHPECSPRKTCSRCSGPILDTEISAMGRSWHPHCFCCVRCGKKLQGNFIIKDGNQTCHECSDSMRPPCHKCGQPLSSEYVTFNGAKLHGHCHVCSHCAKPLALSGFYEVRGLPRCESCLNK